MATPITVKDIVTQYLKKNGFDGLCEQLGVFDSPTRCYCSKNKPFDWCDATRIQHCICGHWKTKQKRGIVPSPRLKPKQKRRVKK